MSKGHIPPFIVDLPDGWDDRTVYLFMGPDDSGVQHTMQLVIDPDTGGADLEEYALNRIDATMEALQGAEILKKEEKTLSNGLPAFECVYKWIPVDNQIIFKKNIYIIIDGVGYSFSGNFSKKTLKTIGVEMDRIIDSFRPSGMEEDED